MINSTSAGESIADASRRGDNQLVIELLDAGHDVNGPMADGSTALHWACYHSDAELAELLISRDADSTAETRYGVTPIELACQNGNTSIVSLLLQNGADANTAAAGDESALMIASRTGRVEIVSSLIQAGADIDHRDDRGQSSIMWAAAEGHDQVVDLLLEHDAEFLEPLSSGFTPLLFAVRSGHLDAAVRLIEAGADVNVAMDPANTGGKNARKNTSPLILAIENGHFEMAARLLELGADPNDERTGFAPLHQISWVRKPNRGDGDDGSPPPIGSGNLTSLEFVRLIVERGADVNLRLSTNPGGRISRRGATPFFMACDTADLELMMLLVELGADPTIGNVDGCTPLVVAAGLGTHAPGEEAGTEEEVLRALEFLLANGGEVNVVDDNGETAMHAAAYKNLPKVVYWLFEHGAEIDIWNRPNERNWTPILIAEGFRPGNFKPSFATIDAIHDVMRQSGVEPPPLTDPFSRRPRTGYER